MSGYQYGAAKPLRRVAPATAGEVEHARNIVEAATERAERIIREARRQATLIVIDAETQASIIRELAYDQGCALAEKRATKAEKQRGRTRLLNGTANAFQGSRPGLLKDAS